MFFSHFKELNQTMKKQVTLVLALGVLMLLETQSEASDEMSSSTTTQKTEPTMTPEQRCQNASASCEDCVKLTSCYYCKTTEKCSYYPYEHIFPKVSDCDMGEIRWGKCWLNFKAMIISIGVLAGLLLLSFIFCICCCCRSKKRSRLIQDEVKREREREERRIRNQERQRERQARNDEIRKKYGLIKDDHPYHKFDA